MTQIIVKSLLLALSYSPLNNFNGSGVPIKAPSWSVVRGQKIKIFNMDTLNFVVPVLFV